MGMGINWSFLGSSNDRWIGDTSRGFRYFCFVYTLYYRHIPYRVPILNDVSTCCDRYLRLDYGRHLCLEIGLLTCLLWTSKRLIFNPYCVVTQTDQGHIRPQFDRLLSLLLPLASYVQK